MPWLQGGCEVRLAGSASMDGFVSQLLYLLLRTVLHVSNCQHGDDANSTIIFDKLKVVKHVPVEIRDRNVLVNEL